MFQALSPMTRVRTVMISRKRCDETQPVLVANEKHEIMIPTVNSFTLSAHLPKAQLIIYPDSGHGALFQHAGAYTSHVSEFLERSDALVV
jgi:pimeloyl-ACP methyl ester carboxylesterase